MTKRISSLVDVKEAVIKLKSKSVLAKVEFACPCTSFSFEGYIVEFDDMTLRIEGIPVAGQEAPQLILSAFMASQFDGDLREDDLGFTVALPITRPSSEKPTDLYRFSITGEWRSEQVKAVRPN